MAAAVKQAASDSTVDLKSPQVKIQLSFLACSQTSNSPEILMRSPFMKYLQFSILVELLPIAGVPNGSIVAAVSVLPQNLVNTKPRLCVKALASDSKARDGRH